MKTRLAYLRVAALAGVLLAMLLLPQTAARAGNVNPGVIPPNAHPAGRPYAEWSAAWWKWALEQPVASNPVLDTTGEYCGVGQSGQVWFLAGVFGSGTATRTCTIPNGKFVYLPIANLVYVATPDDPCCPGDNPELGRPIVEQYMASVQIDYVTIDGRQLTDWGSYNVTSPIFNVALPADNVFGLPEGRYGAIAAGIQVMQTPLSPGQHTIHLRASSPDIEVTYNLTVAND